jgi:hypothetical protein
VKEPERIKLIKAFPESCIVELNLRRVWRRMRDVNPAFDPTKAARERRFKVEILARRNGAFPARLMPK